MKGAKGALDFLVSAAAFTWQAGYEGGLVLLFEGQPDELVAAAYRSWCDEGRRLYLAGQLTDQQRDRFYASADRVFRVLARTRGERLTRELVAMRADRERERLGVFPRFGAWAGWVRRLRSLGLPDLGDGGGVGDGGDGADHGR